MPSQGLVRERAGRYHSADDRFTVEESDGSWFVQDHAQDNGFGQPLLLGPFGSLRDARDAVTATAAKQISLDPKRRERSTKGSTGRRRSTTGGRSEKRPAQAAAAAKPGGEKRKKPAPLSWIDRLPDEEARHARELTRAAERAGLADAEQLVRREVLSGRPALAAGTLGEEAEARAVAAAPMADRDEVRRIVRAVLEVVTEAGLHRAPGLPGWELLETHGPTEDPRRIVLPETDPEDP
jgi:hypothetical protein